MSEIMLEDDEKGFAVEKTVSAEKLAEELGFKLVSGSGKTILLNTLNVSRPGLFLAGFTSYFGDNRVQVFGNAEMEYLAGLSETQRMEKLDRFCAQVIPCIIIARGRDAMKEMYVAAEKYGVPILLVKDSTTAAVNKIVMFLNKFLAPEFTTHAGLMDVCGMGVLLQGKSGIGKSETELELVQRGHRLIADDSVIIKRVDDRLTGTAPEVIRYFMEIRGVGVIDVRSMYGVGSVMLEKQIDLVIEIENWDEKREYDRIGDVRNYEEILGVRIPKFTIPVRPGRNLAIIIEVACRNMKLREHGYDAASEILKRSDLE